MTDEDREAHLAEGILWAIGSGRTAKVVDVWNDVEVSSLTEYLNLVTSAPDIARRLYRGQQDSAWELVPKLYRLAASTSHPNVQALEVMLLINFKEESFPFKTWRSPSDWHEDWIELSVAQHHGMATRLLDWTKNPLSALWFAVAPDALYAVDGAVYVLTTNDVEFQMDTSLDPLLRDKVEVVVPPPVVQRMWNQTAWFTSHPADTNGRYLDIPFTSGPDPTRMIIPASAKARVREDLHQLSIDEFRLFYDLDGLCRHLNWFSSEYTTSIATRP